MAPIQVQLLELFEGAGSNGLKQDDLQRGLSNALGGADVDLVAMADSLNKMLKEGLITVFRLTDGTLVYRRQSTQEATRFQGLTSEERLVLQLIESTGNSGMWTRDIRLRSNLQQVQIPKILKTLETRKLIKAVKSVASKNKKMYMLYDLEPPHEPFYNDDQELDIEFIQALQAALLQHVEQRGQPCTLEDCWKFIRTSRISMVELRHEDVQMILDALVFAAKLEQVQVHMPASRSTALGAGAKGAGPRGGASASGSVKAYKSLHTTGVLNALALVPCSVCSLVASCQEAHQISPESCEYFTRWLEGVNDW